MTKKSFHIHVFAIAALGPGVSGGDKIFIECVRVWAAEGHAITIYVTEEGLEMCQRYGITKVQFAVIRVRNWLKTSFALHYFLKTVHAVLLALKLSLDKSQKHIIYSAGDSLPDVLPSFLLRLRHAASRWVAAFFFFAPTPWLSKQDEVYRGGRLPISFRSVLYFLFQQLAYPLIKNRSDFILACNHLDVLRMQEDGIEASKILAIYGGVDLSAITCVPEVPQKTYEGCFVGRFHIQKGVLPLIEIWARVVQKLPKAHLAIIGEGSLLQDMIKKIDLLNLQPNITILGYLDGDEKYRILKASRLFLHTPTHDTGGMAAAEAMACGLPVIGFDLPGYRYCYPQGMLKVPPGDLDGFAREIIDLLFLNDPGYQELARKAKTFAMNWDWSVKAKEIESIFDRLFMPGQTMLV